MNSIFWLMTFLLLAISFVFILPWLRNSLTMLVISTLITASSYGLYLAWGSSQHLKQYYSVQAKFSRLKQAELRQLLAEFRKEEFRLRARLEKDPTDQDAEWRLLDVLAIKALHNHEYVQAVQYWEKALAKIPDRQEMEIEKGRISGILKAIRKITH